MTITQSESKSNPLGICEFHTTVRDCITNCINKQNINVVFNFHYSLQFTSPFLAYGNFSEICEGYEDYILEYWLHYDDPEAIAPCHPDVHRVREIFNLGSMLPSRNS